MINHRYEIIKLLGEGRSRVFLCSDTFLSGAQYAIKILSLDASKEEHDFFKNEFETLQKFNHPNIVKVYEFGTILQIGANESNFGIANGSKFILLEYCEGRLLTEFSFQNHSDFLEIIIAQICSTLFYLHISNYIYFDLKRQNIIVSVSENDLQIKLIDFGFVGKASETNQSLRRGTPIYIAPEIVQNNVTDYRADLYSLGILIYKLVYGVFPFKIEDELSIYHDKINGEYEFPQITGAEKYISVIKRLVETDPNKRYKTSLQVIEELCPGEIIRAENWFAADAFIDCADDIEEVNKYITDPERREVLIIKGFDGSGKTSLAGRIKNSFANTIYMENIFQHKPKMFPLLLIYRLLYNEEVFSNIGYVFINKISQLFLNKSIIETEELKALIIQIAQKAKFILIIDDYDRFDEIAKEYVRQILPVLQIKGSKVILLENLSNNLNNHEIKNRKEHVLNPFTEIDIHEFIEKNFASFFPKAKVEELVLKGSDYLPGEIILFLRDLMLYGVLKITAQGILVEDAIYKNAFIGSRRSFYEKRIALLTIEEKIIVELLSAIETNVSDGILAYITKQNTAEIKGIINNLKQKNILMQNTKYSLIHFASPGLKHYIYEAVSDKQKLHSIIAEALEPHRDFSALELSRQFELAQKYEKCYEILKPEIERAKNNFAYNYLKKTFLRLLRFPLLESILIEIKKEYVDALIKSGDPVTALKIIEEIPKLDSHYFNELMAKKAICMVNTGKIESGVLLLLEELEKIKPGLAKSELMLELANAELNTNDFEDVTEICNMLIVSDAVTKEQKGRCFNFLGIIEIQFRNNPDKAIDFFHKALALFEEADLPNRIARLKINLGNIYNMKGNHSKAEEYWAASLEINTSIGNLEQEALLLMNFGIYYYDLCSHEMAMDLYKKAETIFIATGNKNGEALGLVNQAENLFLCCEYSKSLAALEKAKNIFVSTKNFGEEASCLFILSKNYLLLGSKEEAQNYLLKYKFLIHEHNLGQMHELQLNFIETLKFIDLSEECDPDYLKKLETISEKLYAVEDMDNFRLSVFLLAKKTITKKNYAETKRFLANKKNVWESNIINKSAGLYLKGLSEKGINEPYQEYLFEAYDLIKGQSITELTWMILFAIAESYFERGIMHSAEEYANIVKKLILYVAENIDDEILRISYLAQPERRRVLQKINIFEKHFTRS